MSFSEIITNAPSWFAFGAITFLGAFTAYYAIRSKVVQAVGAFVLAMIGGFALLLLLGSVLSVALGGLGAS